MGGLHVKVALAGREELAARFGVLRKELESRRRATMWRAVILVREQARSKVHSPEGRARRGIRADVTGAGDALRGLVRTRNRAAIFSQRTREPGKAMPPVKWIRRWLRRIGHETSRSSAFLVARAIARRGTKGRPVMAAALEAKRVEVVALFREMLLRALKGR